jgi:hypothetical protein
MIRRVGRDYYKQNQYLVDRDCFALLALDMIVEKYGKELKRNYFKARVIVSKAKQSI